MRRAQLSCGLWCCRVDAGRRRASPQAGTKGFPARTAARLTRLISGSIAGEKLDPRAAIAGLELPSPPGHSPSETAWQSGLFDRGSWMEAQVGGGHGKGLGRSGQALRMPRGCQVSLAFQPRNAGSADHLLACPTPPAPSRLAGRALW